MEYAKEYKPLLRWPLDLSFTSEAGKELVVLSDPLLIAEQVVAFPRALLAIIGRFDGEHTVQQILAEGGVFGVTHGLVNRLISELDALYFLDNARSSTRLNAFKQEFRELSTRPASHAGLVYPQEVLPLRNVLNRYIAEATTKSLSSDELQKVISVICPHIDYRRGGLTYGALFSVFKKIQKPDVIFLFGTAHQPGSTYFHLTNKSFETPLGTFSAATEVIKDIASRYGEERTFRDEFLHKYEHSLELQLPFLAHRYNPEPLPQLVPILVSSFHELLVKEKHPLEIAEVNDFVNILAETVKQLRDSGKRVLLFGGVDLAHMGQQFGDTERVSDNGLQQIEERDQELLNSILETNEHALFEHMVEDLDKRRICGFPSIYTMLSAKKQAGIPSKGHLLEYRQSVDTKSDCIVTFASAAWTEV